jgi:segregation and condensation protein B
MMGGRVEVKRTSRDLVASTNNAGITRASSKYWFFIHYLAREEQSIPLQLGPQEVENRASQIVRLEAALFLCREGISAPKLAKLAGLADATEARTLIRQLNERYDEVGSAFRIEEVAGGYCLLTRSKYAAWLRRLAHVPNENRLSQSVLETLAIVAYRQPVLRADVESIRGVGSSEALKHLMELDLVRINGRSEDLGRPYLYGTTRRFLQMFGLRSADRLPRREWVNELQLTLISPQIAGSDSGAKESTVTKSFSAVLHEDQLDEMDLPQNQPVVAIDEDEDEEYFDEEFDDEDDFEDDEDWEDEDEEDDEDDEEDDLEGEGEWEEVSDDDEGWDEDDEDEEEDDDEELDDEEEDWEEDEEEEEEEWD